MYWAVTRDCVCVFVHCVFLNVCVLLWMSVSTAGGEQCDSSQTEPGESRTISWRISAADGCLPGRGERRRPPALVSDTVSSFSSMEGSWRPVISHTGACPWSRNTAGSFIAVCETSFTYRPLLLNWDRLWGVDDPHEELLRAIISSELESHLPVLPFISIHSANPDFAPVLRHGFKALLCGYRIWVRIVKVLLIGFPQDRDLFISFKLSDQKVCSGKVRNAWKTIMISQTLDWERKTSPRRNKIFMMHLEQIPSCIRLCNFLWMQSRGKEAGALCCSLSRDACRQMLAVSKLQWGRWQCQLLNCGGEQTAHTEQGVWDMAALEPGSGLSFPRFLYWHLMARLI